jgi:hypothetical protein
MPSFSFLLTYYAKYALISMLFISIPWNVSAQDGRYLDSPVMPRIPLCDASKPVQLEKKSSKKIFLCAMFKDEEGFLAEFVAYYKVHGFDHIMLWNGNSRDDYMSELAPWVESGFVEVREISSLRDRPHVQNAKNIKDPYFRVIAMQKEVERQCISWGKDEHFNMATGWSSLVYQPLIFDSVCHDMSAARIELSGVLVLVELQ